MEHGFVEITDYEDGVVYCGVNPIRSGGSYPDLPVLKPQSGFIQVPKEGDLVAIDELSDGTKFITNVISKTEASPDTMKEGDMVIQLDEQTKLVFKRNGKGSYNIQISASATLSLSAEGSISLDAPDGVFINGTKFQEHTHDHSWSDSGGSGTTTSPN